MCLAFVAIRQHPDCPLLLLFNRDEGHSRSTLAAHWWQDREIFAGRDLAKGGTWAAVDRSGKFAMLTFVRGPRENREPTIARGEIVPRWMQSNGDAGKFLAELEADSELCLGYNLVFGDLEKQYHFNNRSGSYCRLAPGIHGVSNADLHDPWFKVERGKARIRDITRLEVSRWEAECIELLSDQTLAPDNEVQATGLAFEREKGKSGIFVNLDTYGTIASSVIRYSTARTIEVVERCFGPNAKLESETRERFSIQG